MADPTKFVCVPVEPYLNRSIMTKLRRVYLNMLPAGWRMAYAILLAARGPEAEAHVVVKRENLEKAIELLHANGDRMIAQLLEADLTQSQEKADG